MDPTPIYYAIAALLALVGLAGIVIPALPGLPLLYAGMLLAAWADGFRSVGIPMLVVLGLLTLVSLLVDFWATAIGARRVGASRPALAGAVLGTLFGLFLGPFGILLGPFAGALAGELLHRRRLGMQDLGHATRVGLGTWLGILFGVALKLGLAFAMIGLFALAWWL